MPAFTPRQAVRRLAETEQQWMERGHGLCAVERKDTGEFIGRCGLNHWPQFDEVEAGWTLKPAAWGHGDATKPHAPAPTGASPATPPDSAPRTRS